MGAALLFWGWQSGCWIAAAIMAVVLESSRMVEARWECDDRDYARIWDVCTALMAAALLYAVTSNQGPDILQSWMEPVHDGRVENPLLIVRSSRGILAFSQWLPLVFFLLMAAQAFSRQDLIDAGQFSAIIRWVRRRISTPPASLRFPVNVSYPYFSVCLVAACVGRPEGVRFYVGACILLAWALWPVRSRRLKAPVWAMIILVAVGGGVAGNYGLERLRDSLENYNPDWLTRFLQNKSDARESQTSIGTLGRIKLSGRILFWITPRDGAPPPCLREASYHLFRSPTWFGAGADKDFNAVTSKGNDGASWLLVPDATNTAVVTIAGALPRGSDLVPLPHGTTRFILPAVEIKTNRFGAVRVIEPASSYLIFEARHGSEQTFDSGPDENDLQVPESEKPALDQVLQQLKLDGLSQQEKQRAIQRFFADFEYSTWNRTEKMRTTNETPLAAFLLRSRTGHCEFFATATTLLLRRAGIPARYATGYSVQERSGSHFIVRQRHAHAWCLMYADGVWRNFDTTPASWVQEENEQASLFEFLSDFWARFWLEFQRLRHGEYEIREYAGYLAFPLLLAALFQLVMKSRKKGGQRKTSTGPAPVPPPPGMDSEFYLVEQLLIERGLVRASSEGMADWLRRVKTTPGLAPFQGTLKTALRLHYRYRFDPAGISAVERQELAACADRCLQTLQTSQRGSRESST
jgi:transglutaminase-like putative cysteine protease